MTGWTLKQVQGDEAAESCAVPDWERALARLDEAQAALDAGRHEEDQDAYDALLDSHSAALAGFLALPAPDLPAIAAKLDIIVPQLAWELTGCEDCLEISATTPTALPRRRPDSVHAEARRRGEAVPTIAEGV